MKKKKLASLLLCMALVAMLGLMAGCSKDEETEESSDEQTEFEKAVADQDKYLDPLPDKDTGVQVGIILSSLGNEFWQTEADGAEAAGEEFGVDVDVQATDDDTDFTGQLDLMETMISKEYAGLAVSPLSENNLVNGIAEANDKDVKVILNGTLQNEDAMEEAGAAVDGIMEMDFHKQGVMAGEYVVDQTDGEGQVAIIAGTEGATQSDGRRDGAKETMEEAGMEVVAVQQCDFDQQKAYDATKNIMQANPDIVAITCGNDDMAMGVISALQELDKKDDVIVVGNDFTSQAKESIKEGELDASVAMSPYLGGRAAVIAILKAAQGQDVGTISSSVPMILVTADNVADMEDWK